MRRDYLQKIIHRNGKQNFMRRILIYTLALATLFLFHAVSPAQTTHAQQVSIVNANASPADIDRIVRAFSAKETQFRRALNEYAFKRDAVIQTIGMGGQITGEYHRVSFFTFDDSGNRYEKISFFPTPTLTDISVTEKGIPEDKNNKYPTFETYREQIDGRYWFPTYTSADDNLDFGGNVVHMRMLVRYSDFKRGHAEVKITEVNGDEIENAPAQKPATNTNPTNNTSPTNNSAPPTMSAPTKQPAPSTGSTPKPMPLTGGVLHDYA